jgi:hypothetical protein
MDRTRAASSEALNPAGAQPEHHHCVGGITNIQKIGQQKRGEIFALHRCLQARQTISRETLHVDAEWCQI